MLFDDFIVYFEEYFSILSHPIISKYMPIRIGSYIIKYAQSWICGFDPETLINNSKTMREETNQNPLI